MAAHYRLLHSGAYPRVSRPQGYQPSFQSPSIAMGFVVSGVGALGPQGDDDGRLWFGAEPIWAGAPPTSPRTPHWLTGPFGPGSKTAAARDIPHVAPTRQPDNMAQRTNNRVTYLSGAPFLFSVRPRANNELSNDQFFPHGAQSLRLLFALGQGMYGSR